MLDKKDFDRWYTESFGAVPTDDVVALSVRLKELNLEIHMLRMRIAYVDTAKTAYEKAYATFLEMKSIEEANQYAYELRASME